MVPIERGLRALALVVVAGCGSSAGQGFDAAHQPGSDASNPGADSPVGPTIDARPNPDGANNGCTGGSDANQPFGNHAHAYTSGSILPDHLSQGELDDQTRAFYDYWKSHYLKSGCGSGRYYVASGQSDRQTVSEAHGYGMLITVFMAGHDPDAKQIFDGLYAYYKDHPSDITPTLMAWSQDSSCANNDGANSATDGDLDIAYSLLLADKQWGSSGTIDYAKAAQAIIGGVHSGDVDASQTYTLLGDWATPQDAKLYDATRSSDFMPSHLISFAAATGDQSWKQVADDTYGIVDTVQTGYAASTGLIPDFIVSPRANPKPASGTLLEGANDGKYSWNACRDPWRIALGYLVDGDARAKTIAQRLNGWIKSETGGDPNNVKAGYALNGGALVDYSDRSYIAPFGVAAMVDASNQQWLNSVWDNVSGARDGSYYDDSITMLSMIAMSGNWWVPEAAPCP